LSNIVLRIGGRGPLPGTCNHLSLSTLPFGGGTEFPRLVEGRGDVEGGGPAVDIGLAPSSSQDLAATSAAFSLGLGRSFAHWGAVVTEERLSFAILSTMSALVFGFGGTISGS
jgi:hypothetical protein